MEDSPSRRGSATSGGLVVQGRRAYRLVRRLGDGGSAEVFVGAEVTTGIEYAVKVMLPGVVRNATLVSRFVAEAQAMAEIDHPRVVGIVDVGLHSGRPLLVMQIAPRGTLAQHIRAHGRLPSDLAIDMILQVVSGVEAAHRLGIIHRDIKPQNVLIAADGGCLLTDFGIARVMDGAARTSTGAQMGTLGYVSPEQLSDATKSDVRADIYGIGATLYHMVTGHVPTNAFIDLDAPALERGQPRELLEVMQRACAYKPRNRYGSVRALRLALLDVRRRLPYLAHDGLPRGKATGGPRFPAIVGTASGALDTFAERTPSAAGPPAWTGSETVRPSSSAPPAFPGGTPTIRPRDARPAEGTPKRREDS